jgi:probable F420-dependent oxidoreductase
MRLGVAIFLTDRTIAPDELGRAVEERGLASLFVPEHTHVPVDHSTHPAGGDLPDEYRRTLDPFVTLTAAAAVTDRLRLGTGICLLAQRDPIVTAKEVATLDLLSAGRFTFGVGYGWNVAELAHHGVPWGDRRAVVRDRLHTMRSLWTDEVAASEAARAPLSRSWAWPKPVQQPHPPVLLGAGLGPRTLEDLVAVCDGWMPIGARSTETGMPKLRAAWRDAGRAGDPIVHVCGTTPKLATLTRLADLGVDEVSLWLPSAPAPEVLPVLDRFAELGGSLA